MTIRQGFSVNETVDLAEGVSFAADRGFDFVELDMESPFARRRVDATAVREVADEYGIDLLVHLPYRLDTASPHEHVREGACRELEAAIDVAVEMGAETGVFHANTEARAESWDDELLRDGVYESIRRVTAYADERDFVACVENLNEPFFDAGDFPDLFERTGATACLDTGHAFVSGYDTSWQADLLREYPDRFVHVHLNDTRIEDDDEHLPVGIGAIEFAPLVEAFEERDRGITCTHEVYSFGPEYSAVGKEQFDRLRGNVRASGDG